MTVKVCDALCGAGKTSAAIRMMNERTEDRFIFVTQYLSETTRIRNCCPERKFISPQSNTENGQTKLSDVRKLLKEGRNIATTHALFSIYTEEIKELVANQRYILVLDEAIDIFTPSDIEENDLDILRKSDSIREENGFVEWTNSEYQSCEGGRFREEMLKAKSKNLLKYDDSFFFWSIPPELFGCFREAYVLTYMFEAQIIRCFFDMYNISYELIGTHKTERGYEFCPIGQMDRKRELRDKVHILEHAKLNQIGTGRTSLSFNWYRTSEEEDEAKDDSLERIRKNLSNLFKNIWKVPASRIMWTTYKACKDALKGRGYEYSFVAYNKRASNEYADRTHLAYCVNIFPRPWERRFYHERGVTFNSDMYGLSTLIQWMFRSALRNGEEIWIYIPSERMRNLLKQWLDNLAEGKDLEPVEYRTPRNYYIPKVKKPKNQKIKDIEFKCWKGNK